MRNNEQPDEATRRRKRLLTTYETVDMSALEDVIYVFALNVEDALITGGAEPGKDYTILDLYKMAMPLAKDYYEKNDVNFVTGYPGKHYS